MKELRESYEQMMEAFESFRNEVRRTDKNLYERWKAGGEAVSSDFYSMYPNATEVFEEIEAGSVAFKDEVKEYLDTLENPTQYEEVEQVFDLVKSNLDLTDLPEDICEFVEEWFEEQKEED